MPLVSTSIQSSPASLPRTRGYARPPFRYKKTPELSPAYAGVCPPPWTRGSPPTALSRVRGGMPAPAHWIGLRGTSLPRTRGYASDGCPRFGADALSPAYAGVCPSSSSCGRGPRALSRVRGGMPAEADRQRYGDVSLPRTRGYAVRGGLHRTTEPLSPAYAGVCPPAPAGAPPAAPLSRVRGGMPNRVSATDQTANSLPRTRGYAREAGEALLVLDLSPAYAGVCRCVSRTAERRGTLSRVRGGMPAVEPFVLALDSSLPRTRGYAVEGVALVGLEGLSPAYAGVCRSTRSCTCTPTTLSRVRGGMCRMVGREHWLGLSPSADRPASPEYLSGPVRYAGRDHPTRDEGDTPWRTC